MPEDQAEAIKAAVLAERQRCYDIVLEAPYLMKGRMAMACKELAFDITSRIRSGEAPTLLGRANVTATLAQGKVA